jgi:predicted NACHT family NTPase
LAERPLLLTVMVQLHTYRGRLPHDRTELYADAVDLLLERWESHIGRTAGIVEQLGIPGLKRYNLEAGLYAVAFQAHSQAGGETSADIAEADLRHWLAPHLGGSYDKAGLFIDYIRERAGLLIRHKTEAYTFIHRSFQEFLAACHLVGLPDYASQAARLVQAAPDRWREVFLLSVGHAARTHRLDAAINAVRYLCPRSVQGAPPAAPE